MEEDVIRRTQAICDGSWDLRILEAVAKELRVAIRKLECHLVQEGRRSYQDWIRESLNSGGGALHRMTLSWGRPLEALSAEQDQAGALLVQPMDIINSKAHRWAQLWEASERPVTPLWLEPLRRRAARQERTDIDEAQVEAGLRCFKARAGLGGDQQNPRWWRFLPQGAIDILVAVLETAERALAWPTPLLLNLAQLIFNDETSDRPITLAQGLYPLQAGQHGRVVGGAGWTLGQSGGGLLAAASGAFAPGAP